MKNFWSYLDNRKTSIGAGCLFSAMVLQQLCGIWVDGPIPDWMGKTLTSLEWLGGLFTGVGLSHKGLKTMQCKGKGDTASAEPR